MVEAQTIQMTRECGSCTKCCEGYLMGEAHGKPFYQGRPCHFVAIGKGCSIYIDRPKEPCVSYKCEWLQNEDIPVWFKPNEINTIITKRKIKDTKIEYWEILEAGDTLQSNVLSWLIVHALNNNINIRWTANGGPHWVGSDEFMKMMNKTT